MFAIVCMQGQWTIVEHQNGRPALPAQRVQLDALHGVP